MRGGAGLAVTPHVAGTDATSYDLLAVICTKPDLLADQDSGELIFRRTLWNKQSGLDSDVVTQYCCNDQQRENMDLWQMFIEQGQTNNAC